MAPSPALIACYMEVPLFQAEQFAGIQTITENVSEAKKIHVIDLGIWMGVQHTVLMQGLASQSLELLKITTIGTDEKHLIQETGKRLERFAQSMGIPFCFRLIMVSDMMDLKENLFELEAEETLVVYSGHVPRSLISDQDRLNNVMKVLRNLNPKIMVVFETELNSSLPSFIDRFIESVLYFSAYFDCCEACLGDNSNRVSIESSRSGEEIKRIVAIEGEERKSRSAKLNVWRAFFGGFGMEETQLSTACLCQASMVAEKFASRNGCTFEKDGKSLLIGWKGTPLLSLSAWRFFSK